MRLAGSVARSGSELELGISRGADSNLGFLGLRITKSLGTL